MPSRPTRRPSRVRCLELQACAGNVAQERRRQEFEAFTPSSPAFERTRVRRRAR